jgi:hypothetical protein
MRSRRLFHKSSRPGGPPVAQGQLFTATSQGRVPRVLRLKCTAGMASTPAGPKTSYPNSPGGAVDCDPLKVRSLALGAGGGRVSGAPGWVGGLFQGPAQNREVRKTVVNFVYVRESSIDPERQLIHLIIG